MKANVEKEIHLDPDKNYICLNCRTKLKISSNMESDQQDSSSHSINTSFSNNIEGQPNDETIYDDIDETDASLHLLDDSHIKKKCVCK